MSLSRFCATVLGALMLSCTAHSFAASEDAPLPGDFAPPRQGKISAKTANGSNGSIKQNDATTRNNPPASSASNQDNASEYPKKPQLSVREKRHVQRSKSQHVRQAAGTVRKQGRHHTSGNSPRHARKQRPAMQHARTTTKHVKKVAIHHSRAAKQPKKARSSATTTRRHHARAIKAGANKPQRAHRQPLQHRSKHPSRRR